MYIHIFMSIIIIPTVSPPLPSLEGREDRLSAAGRDENLSLSLYIYIYIHVYMYMHICMYICIY